MTKPSAALLRASGFFPASFAWASCLAWAGLLDCLLLVQIHSGQAPALCTQGCATVLTSHYSTLRGLPLPWLGALFYGAALAGLLASLAIHRVSLRELILKILRWISVAAATFSGMLVYVQFANLHAFCPLCLGSALISVGLAFALTRALHLSPVEGSSGAPVFALALAIFATLATGTLWISINSKPSPLPIISEPKSAIPLNLSLAETSGPPQAAARLVVFSDYTCEYCRQFAPVLKKVREEHAREVLVAYRAFPKDFHGHGYHAALAAQCASDQGAFWNYHDRLFQEKAPPTDARLIAIAQEAGLDIDRFRHDLSSEDTLRKVDQNAEDALRSGILGTPSVFLNGVMIGGVIDYATLDQRIRAELNSAANSAAESPKSVGH